MIYSGTLPARTPGETGYNVVNVGNTGKGKVARSYAQGHKSPGFLSDPNQAMLTIGRYWKDAMPTADKDYWKARANEDTFRTRSFSSKTVTGYTLFMMSNLAALVLNKELVKIPPALENFLPILLELDSVEADANRLKAWSWVVKDPASEARIEFMVSAIHPHHVNATKPKKFTELIGRIISHEFLDFEEGPGDPFYLDLPWDIKPGDEVGFYAVVRFGSQTGWPLWRGETYFSSVQKLIAV